RRSPRPPPRARHTPDGHYPHLGERRAVRITCVLAGVAERGSVLLCVRGVPLQRVDRHQPPAPQEGPPGQQFRGRDRHLAEQLLHRLIPQPLAGLRDPARGRHAPRLIPAAPRGKSLRQPGRDLLIVVIGEQGQRHHQVHHDMRRELPIRALRLLTSSCRPPTRLSTPSATGHRCRSTYTSPPRAAPSPPATRSPLSRRRSTCRSRPPSSSPTRRSPPLA